MIAIACLGTLSLTAQITAPQPSPGAKSSQTVGLTEVDLDYSRPHMRDRVIFGDLVPFDKMWRTGANKNSIITVSDMLIFGKDTLQEGSYSIFTMPKSDKTWEVYFYSDTENWGTPEDWKEENVALKTMAKVTTLPSNAESFTIGVDNVSMEGADLNFSWEKTKATASFTVNTNATVMASIKKTMAGPSAGDYYSAASFYLTQKTELKTALEYIDKALEMRDDQPFWYLRKKALIQAELGDFKGAIASAKLSLEEAKKANYEAYITSNEKSIEEWSKK